jgi:hypothetical protein
VPSYLVAPKCSQLLRVISTKGRNLSAASNVTPASQKIPHIGSE